MLFFFTFITDNEDKGEKVNKKCVTRVAPRVLYSFLVFVTPKRKTLTFQTAAQNVKMNHSSFSLAKSES